MTKVDFYYAQMTSGVWGQWLSLCQVYRTAFRSRDIICDKIYGLKVGLHCFKELQFIGQSETMKKKILFVDPQWRPVRNVLLWQQQLSRWLVNSLRASTPACCYCCLRQTGFINLFVENGDAVEQERIFFLEEFSDYCLVKPSAASLKAWIPCLEPVLKYTDPLWISGGPWSSVQSREVICAQ